MLAKCLTKVITQKHINCYNIEGKFVTALARVMTLSSYHDDHVVKTPPYFNLSIKHVNSMGLFSNVHETTSSFSTQEDREHHVKKNPRI
jgi:hypothetical protein